MKVDGQPSGPLSLLKGFRVNGRLLGWELGSLEVLSAPPSASVVSSLFNTAPNIVPETELFRLLAAESSPGRP